MSKYTNQLFWIDMETLKIWQDNFLKVCSYLLVCASVKTIFGRIIVGNSYNNF
jgi:hypothetical protein